MSVSLDWEEDFPKGYGHTSIAYLKRCVGYEAAKSGDLNAAEFVVFRCVKRDRLDELREKHPLAILLPVLGKNKLPLALAFKVGLPVWLNVKILHTVTRKHLCAIQRLVHSPVFIGFIVSGVEYILVDDVITQGGTIAALRKFVMVRGGKVVSVVALAYAIGSRAIAPLKRHIVRLMVKFSTRIIELLQETGIAPSPHALTNPQVKYLLMFSSIRNIVKKLEQHGLLRDSSAFCTAV
jgi:hypothetical protein